MNRRRLLAAAALTAIACGKDAKPNLFWSIRKNGQPSSCAAVNGANVTVKLQSGQALSFEYHYACSDGSEALPSTNAKGAFDITATLLDANTTLLARATASQDIDDITGQKPFNQTFVFDVGGGGADGGGVDGGGVDGGRPDGGGDGGP